MIILGIDPGLANTGYGIVQSNVSRNQLLHYGNIKTDSKTPSEMRLKAIYDKVINLIDEYDVEEVVLEDVFFSKQVKTAFILGEAKGIIKLAAANSGTPMATYTPLQVKTSVTGYGKAPKTQVQKMVQMLLKLKEIPQPDHAADALALTICHSRSHKLNKLREKFEELPA
ncbi:MAG: crossover junction endodeoxyribonuclease RuvC [Candidatus Poribacteria bacterium]|nr:crossover junction endodeoxyribonuclease RuvC [Candidatus Poribacteria bacterium]